MSISRVVSRAAAAKVFHYHFQPQALLRWEKHRLTAILGDADVVFTCYNGPALIPRLCGAVAHQVG